MSPDRQALCKAMYFVCLALHEEPSVANIIKRVKQQTGRGYCKADVCGWLRSFHNSEPMPNRRRTKAEPVAVLKTGISEPSPNGRRTRLAHAPHKVLELEVIPKTNVFGEAAKEKELVPPPLPERLPPKLPEDVKALKRVALPFLEAFGNCHSVEAKAKNGGEYTDVLAILRGRSATTPQAWQAFSDAWVAGGGKPLFGPKAKKALAHFTPIRGPSSNGHAKVDLGIPEHKYTTTTQERQT